ncbi:hypothetical protein N7481_012267 [Penicillium waksmanii]|uniref:uncharacterized protein n=1 Tax=Penicillium waksmanii TaxID=69791 RepID=UPI0025465CE8|nr:uncharacterized protein N7481_012267 [Penicillium waksmanii]KAJ5965553.1 hypothetical protein N7481_012267 [Penicillium waksmanii]
MKLKLRVQTITQPFHKVCANSTWDLWYAEGFLCCEPGMIGYLSKDSGGDIRKSTFGCNTDAYIKNNGTKLNIERGTRSTPDYPNSGNSTTNNSTTKASNNGTHNDTNILSNNDTNDGPNKGAIAGGVVGGVCGILIIAVIIFIFLRRRRSKISSNSEKSPAEIEGETRPFGELDGTASKRTELEADTGSRQELAGHAFKKTNEGPPSELA